MTLEKIKSELKKQNPLIDFFCVSQYGVFYNCYINNPKYNRSDDKKYYVRFKIPFDKIGTSMFMPVIEAKSLLNFIIL